MGQTLDQAGPKTHVAEIVNHGEKLVLPENLDIDDAIQLLYRRKEYLEGETTLSETFSVFPLDGAHGLNEVLINRYGWAAGTHTPGFFGSKPPQLINIEVAPGQFSKVPWGRIKLPNVTGFLQCGHSTKNGRAVFALRANILRKDEATVQGLFDELRAYLKLNSIYKGKAIKIRFRDNSGNLLELPEPKFMDTSLDRQHLVYSDSIQAAIETSLFTPLERPDDCMENGIAIKRGILLAGPYGTGKTLAASVAAKLAVEHGNTFLYISHADELGDAIEFAKMYQSPVCAVFCEDIDRAMSGDERTVEMDDLLNIIDGIDSKHANIVTVLTTNNLESINQAMLRPGRLDSVIEVLPPDAHAVERLIRLYGGAAVEPETDLTAVGKELQGTIPAVIAEVVKRAKLAQLRRQQPGEKVTNLSSEALLESATSMKAQISLLADRKAPSVPTLDQSFGDLVKKHSNGYEDRLEGMERTLQKVVDAVS